MKTLMTFLLLTYLVSCGKQVEDGSLDSLPNEIHLNCEKIGLVTVKFIPSESATLMLKEQIIELTAEPVASGFKYVKSEIVLRGKDNQITLTIGIQPPFKCIPQVLAQVGSDAKQ